jgi:ubiquinone/menaquinone biosynthesis C-methylase UbiE
MKDKMTTEDDKRLIFSGERYIPNADDIGAETRTEHILRYQACIPFVRDKVVLDVASGEGYGSAMLADVSKSVNGLDVSPEIIKYATSKYSSLKNLVFKCGSAMHLPYMDQMFDIVVSFETIEHLSLDNQRKFLSEVYRVLRRDGIFILSTPNKDNYNLQYPKKNEYHLHELTRNEFIDSLKEFTIHEVFNQSVMSFTSIWREGEENYKYYGKLKQSSIDDVFHIIICGREDSRKPTFSMASLTYDSQLSFCQMRITLQAKEDHIQKVSLWAHERDAKASQLEGRLKVMEDELLQSKKNDAVIKGMQERYDRSEAALAVANDRIRKLESRLGSP